MINRFSAPNYYYRHIIKQMPSLLPEVPTVPVVEQYKKGGKVKNKKGTVTQTVNVYVTKRGGSKRNTTSARPPTLIANGMPVSYQQSLPSQLAEISKIRQDMKLGFQQQQLQLQQLQSHINKPLPATLPEDRKLYPTIAYPPPAPSSISTNINPEHDADLNQRIATIDPTLYPYASSALSSSLVSTINQQPLSFSAHQTPPHSRGGLSSFIRGELNRPDALTLGEALQGRGTSTRVPQPVPFLSPTHDIGTGADPVGRPSLETLMNRREIVPRPYVPVAHEPEPSSGRRYIIEEEEPAPPRRMKKGGKVKK